MSTVPPGKIDAPTRNIVRVAYEIASAIVRRGASLHRGNARAYCFGAKRWMLVQFMEIVRVPRWMIFSAAASAGEARAQSLTFWFSASLPVEKPMKTSTGLAVEKLSFRSVHSMSPGAVRTTPAGSTQARMSPANYESTRLVSDTAIGSPILNVTRQGDSTGFPSRAAGR